MPDIKTSGPLDRSITFDRLKPGDLKPYVNNARVHNRHQVRRLIKLIKAHGFTNPILIDENNVIIGGHARLMAALELGLDTVSVIRVIGRSETEKKALRLADNAIALESSWDIELVKIELETISLDEGFDIELSGLSRQRADAILVEGAADPKEDEIPEAPAKAISRLGDIWVLRLHRLGCGDAKDVGFLRNLCDGAEAAAAFLDVPYNLRVRDIGGKGRIKHPEFAEASGEKSPEEYTAWLTLALGACTSVSRNGAVHFVCMDHRHVEELTAAGAKAYGERLNICVWRKSNAGLGSFYRSQHELIFVYRVGDQPHVNNIELGRHGRNRTNVWDYPSVNTFRGSRRQDLALHPTVKPVGLVADAIMDVTQRGEVVLDSFSGSGTTLIACERTDRRFVGCDINPGYVDLALRRWRALTGEEPIRLCDGRRFSDLESKGAQ
ncbi:MAG TPA: DNA methyltransferase [Hyphomonadaceae bacterium]|nr:DNA methyltransferase [Hyphomonadaceae bacterium]